MSAGIVPIKTAAGHLELAQRTLRLGQRQRTLLLLADGRREVDEVLRQAAAAGVPARCLDELVGMGLLALVPRAAALGAAEAAYDAGPPTRSGDDPTAPDSLLPAVEPLLAESAPGELGGDTRFPDTDSGFGDPDFEAARLLLIRAVRAEAPLAGSLTLLKLRRARTRAELAGLLDEAGQRLRRTHKPLLAEQTLRQVRHLLSLPG